MWIGTEAERPSPFYEFPQFPAVTEYAELTAEIDEARARIRKG